MLLLQSDALHLVLGNQDILHTSHRTVEKKTGSQKQILAPPLLMLIYSKEEEKKKNLDCHTVIEIHRLRQDHSIEARTGDL